MATRKFTSYDLIADIVPGGVSVILFYPLTKSIIEDFTADNLIFSGVALLILVYFIGRSIHEFCSWLERYSTYSTITNYLNQAKNANYHHTSEQSN